MNLNRNFSLMNICVKQTVYDNTSIQNSGLVHSTTIFANLQITYPFFQDFEMAVSTLESIFDKPILSDSERVRVLSNLGRVYLQLGDVTAASAAFAKAKDKSEKLVSDQQVRST